MDKEAVQLWYDQNRARYADLTGTLETLMKTLLEEASIPYHSVNGRVKDRDSCTEKFGRKDYTSPEQMMDIAGLRIITHTTAEVTRICDLIEREFDVDKANSGDKAAEMGIDKVGYLSVHYVVRLTPARIQLREYARFGGLCCEIQVRSLLQHAWAEIEHDRGYKFTGVLPETIQRKFYLIAGTLELMDLEFCALSQEIDRYADYVKDQAAQGQVDDIAIDSTSLLQFLNEFFKECSPEELVKAYHSDSSEVIDELSHFGIETLRQLKDLLGKKSPKDWIPDTGTSYVDILRDAMIWFNPEKYFKEAWQQHWSYDEPSTLEFWEQLGINLDELEKYIRITRDYGGGLNIEKR